MSVRTIRALAWPVLLVALCTSCGGDSDNHNNNPPSTDTPVVLVANSSNVVSYWHDVGMTTVNATAAVATTPEELRPAFQTDLATMHLAMYDAISAIDGRYQPFLVTLPAATGASLDAAGSAAAYNVLRVLFPNRAAQYQAAYDSYVAAIPAGDARTRGLALGAEVAAAVVANRANDGRMVTQSAYVPGTAPGKFRGVNPLNRYFPAIRPFTMLSIGQFLPLPPPALDSATYAADLNEVKALGGAVSTVRTAEQFEIARFHTEAPAIYLTRNFGRFAKTTANASDAARLMAIIYIGYSDAITACFNAKYAYESWRPQSAIPLADTDNNPATTADPAWTPSVPTPNHPEYPAAHSCTAGALGELLRYYYGTDKVTYTFDSTVTGTTRTYANTDALAEESRVARIYGGMHFRFSTTAGAAMGKQVANWSVQGHFQKR
ncbi:MAG: phosphatase PAP2 family protein [Massilia sp.]